MATSLPQYVEVQAQLQDVRKLYHCTKDELERQKHMYDMLDQDFLLCRQELTQLRNAQPILEERCPTKVMGDREMGAALGTPGAREEGTHPWGSMGLIVERPGRKKQVEV